MTSVICAVCGKPEEDHHEFVPKIMLDGCVCDPGTWGGEVFPICAEYKGNGTQYCETCEHDKGCHK